MVTTYEEIKNNKNIKKEILNQYKDRINYKCFNYEGENSEFQEKLEKTFDNPTVLKYILDMNLNYKELLVLYFLTISYFPNKNEEKLNINVTNKLRDINTTTSENSFNRKDSLIYQYKLMVDQCRTNYENDPDILKNYSREEIDFIKDFPIGTYVRYISKVRRLEYEKMNSEEYVKKTQHGTKIAYVGDDDSNGILNESNNRYDNLRDKINLEYGVITGYYQPENVEYKQAKSNAFSIFPRGTDVLYKKKRGYQIVDYDPKTKKYQITMKVNNESYDVLIKDIEKEYTEENNSKYTFYNGPDYVHGLPVKIIGISNEEIQNNNNQYNGKLTVKLVNIPDSAFDISSVYLYRASDISSNGKITSNNEVKNFAKNSPFYDVKIKGGIFNGFLGNFTDHKEEDKRSKNFKFELPITNEKHPIELDNLLFLYKLTNNDVNKIKEKKQIDGEIILNVSLDYIQNFIK